MKAVHITTVHQPFDQRIFYRECISLSKAGSEVVLLVRHDKDQVMHSGVKIISLGAPVRRQSSIRIVSRLYSVLLALTRALSLKADIYHLHDPELLLILPFLKLMSSARVVCDFHEDNVGFMHQKQYLPVFIRSVMAKIMVLFEWSAAHIADAIITADPGVEKRFQEKGVKTVLLYNFPRLDFFPIIHANKKKYDLVYHGSIPRYHMEVCFAIDKLLIQKGREVKWIFMGSYGDPEWMENYVVEKGIKSRFEFRGRIPHDEVAGVVRSARLGIIPLPDLPKFQYNIPTKLFEFMALEMPVVMSDLPPSRPFVKECECAVMVRPDDYEAYADEIIKLLNDEETCKRMGRLGRLKVETMYNWDTEAEKLKTLYAQMI